MFIHEGAKAARAAANIDDSHPWARELAHAAHLGWIGGAQSPHRTNWAVLKRAGVKRVYIVPDNDRPGRTAMKHIIRAIDLPCWMVQFNRQWPVSFDMADPFPDSMFEEKRGERHFQGPAFWDCAFPVTWATRKIDTGKPGRPAYELRDSFLGIWAYIEDVEAFVCRERPERLRSKTQLNDILMSCSDVDNTVRLMLKSKDELLMGLAYRPDRDEREVYQDGKPCVNVHVPPNIRPSSGDPGPWLEFMRFLVPDERERHQLLRWCATLVGRPDIRMEYAVLMVTDSFGIGKTTLGESVLAPLVGIHNTSFPGESDLDSEFNDWIAHKRLAVIGEIHTAYGWKRYNVLKSIITDRLVRVNQKYQKQYLINNWVHLYACSNSRRALKAGMGERRWFYPRLSERKWPREKYGAFKEWLRKGGLEIILHWARSWEDYVVPGEHAPSTGLKEDLIEESVSDVVAEAKRLGRIIADQEEPVIAAGKRIMRWSRGSGGQDLEGQGLHA